MGNEISQKKKELNLNSFSVFNPHLWVFLILSPRGNAGLLIRFLVD